MKEISCNDTVLATIKNVFSVTGNEQGGEMVLKIDKEVIGSNFKYISMQANIDERIFDITIRQTGV